MDYRNVLSNQYGCNRICRQRLIRLSTYLVRYIVHPALAPAVDAGDGAPFGERWEREGKKKIKKLLIPSSFSPISYSFPFTFSLPRVFILNNSANHLTIIHHSYRLSQ